jgi:type VI secretion system protein ImpA
LGRFCKEQLASRGEATGDGAAAAGDGSGEVAFRAGAINSRADAIRALDAVAEYFRRHEPSSPIPLFVDRAKRLVAKDFSRSARRHCTRCAVGGTVGRWD